MREVIAEYTAEDIYSTKRAEIQDRIRKQAETMLGEKMMEGGENEEAGSARSLSDTTQAMLNLIDTLILGIELPTAVVSAINRKIEQYYISEEYKFRVAREIRESERKKMKRKVSANSSRSSRKASPTPICAGAASRQPFSLPSPNNAKIVIVGSGKDGLPIILGNVDGSSAPPPPAGNKEILRPRRGRRRLLRQR